MADSADEPGAVDEAIVVAIVADHDIVVARQAGRGLADAAGLSATDGTLVATAISEIARNILTYAGSGELQMRIVRSARRVGVEIVAVDHGPGIAEPELALQDGYSTGAGMGLGLSGARRLMDEFTLRAPLGVGTTITMRKWSRGR